MIAICLAVAGTSMLILYETAFEEERERLTETAQSQARLIEAIARFDAIYSSDYPGGPVAATLSQIIDAHQHCKGFGSTGEFTLAHREGNNIIFLLSHRHDDLDHPKPVPFDSDLAEPMHRALSEQSGTVIGLDYRGKKVLAAYEPMAELNLGIVAKIDLAEVRAPFVRAIFIAIGIMVLVVLVGTTLFLRVGNPIIRRLQEQAIELVKINEQLKKEIEERKQAEETFRRERDKAQKYLDIAGVIFAALNTDQTVEMINKKGCEALGHAEEDIIGKNWVDNFIPQRMRDNVKAAFSKLLLGKIEPIEYFENPVLTKTGEERLIAWHNTIIRDESGNIIGTLSSGSDITERTLMEEALRKAHDELEIRVAKRTAELSESNDRLRREIAERKRTEEALRLNESRLEALVKLSHRVDTSTSVMKTADFVLEEGIKLTRSKIGFLGFMNDTETEMAIHAWSKDTMTQCSVINTPLHFPIEKAGIWGEAVRKRKPIIINDYAASHPQKKGYPNGHVELFRFMVVPVFDNGRIVTVAGMANKEDKYDTADVRQLTLLLDGMWRIIQHRRDEERQKKSEEELRHLSSKILNAHEEESKRIGQELHDGLAQTLSAIKFGVEGALMYMGQENPVEASDSLESIVALAQGAVEEVRRISKNLRPSALDDLGILATISWLCNEFETLHSDIGIKKRIDLQEEDVPDHLRIVIFRILQEALNNIAKHSEAHLVNLSLKGTSDHIELGINDNGIGFGVGDDLSSEQFTKGLGLTSMKERTELSGGSFSINSSYKTGTTIRAIWPIGGG